MSNETPTFHDVTDQALQEISKAANVPKRKEFSITEQVSEVDDTRQVIDITRTRGGPFKESTYIQTSSTPIESDGRWKPQPGGVPTAELGTSIEHNGERGSRASVQTNAGHYFAVERTTGISSEANGRARVERPGYGSVELKNPKAKSLIASLAAKAIKKIQQDENIKTSRTWKR